MLDQPIETLSKGFKRRVGLAQAILHDPPVLIMDEPTDGLDPNQKHSVRDADPRHGGRESDHRLDSSAGRSRSHLHARRHHRPRPIVADGTPEQLLTRSRYHNAVTITVPESLRAPVMAGLKSLSNLASVEGEKRDGGLFQITAFPRKNALLIEDVSALAVREKWDVRELHAEAGRLDEVFRAITTHDAARSKAAAT